MDMHDDRRRRSMPRSLSILDVDNSLNPAIDLCCSVQGTELRSGAMVCLAVISTHLLV